MIKRGRNSIKKKTVFMVMVLQSLTLWVKVCAVYDVVTLPPGR